MSNAKAFFQSESGAVTVDWVVLTAAIVSLALAVLVSVSGSTLTLASAISDAMSSIGIGDGASGSDESTETESWTTGDRTEWNGMYAGQYWGIGDSQTESAEEAREISLATAAADAPAGFNLDNPLISPGQNGVVYTSTDGSHYSVNGYVTAVQSDGSYVDEWGGTRNVTSWAGN